MGTELLCRHESDPSENKLRPFHHKKLKKGRTAPGTRKGPSASCRGPWEGWWAMQGSNLRPSACKAAALPLRQSPVTGAEPPADLTAETGMPCEGGTSYPPTDCTAVLSAMGSLTSEFGMGSGDPPLHGSARAGHCPHGPMGPSGARRAPSGLHGVQALHRSDRSMM